MLLKKKNIAREERRDVMNKIMRDVFFEGEGMGEVYRRKLVEGSLGRCWNHFIRVTT